MAFRPTSFSLAALAAVSVAPSLRAQWATFQNQTSTRLVAAAGLGSADTQEKDYAWGDFDQDGDTDLVCVRKQPFTSPGKFPNVLFMNENGVLTDRTAALASASTVAGSQGMLDATNDRDVVAVDVNGDGWLDLVTCTTLSLGDPQYIRVPRVYINRGNNVAMVWQGFLYDDALRIDDTPWQGGQRFCSVAAGDIDGDGDQDLYFGDYQQPTGTPRPFDVNDILMLNNGNGYFTDVSSARMTAQMLESSFGMKVAIVDMNGDGRPDIIKDDALNAPQAISISYNDGPTPGFFGSYQIAYAFAPYHFNINDLNNDNLPDMIVSDDGDDRYILHTGVSGGLATFAPAFTFTFTGGGGGDDGFGGNNIIADLNNDGWNDAIIADVDVDLAGCNRRCHIYRNLGDAPNVTLREEVVGGAVVGIPTASLVGTFDVAVFDINGDGWKDMVIGRCTGTQVWINQPPTGMTFSYVGGLPSLVPPGQSLTIDVNATGIGGVVPQPGSGRLYYSVNGAAFTQTTMADLGAGQYRGTLPALNCVDSIRFYVTANGVTGTFSDPPTAPAAFHSATAAVGTGTIYSNNFEVASTGWQVVNTTLTTGAWERAVPNGTQVLAQPAAPSEDGEALTSATRCFVTQNGAVGGAANSSDVDGGPTDLISPPLNFAGTDGFISYRRWFFRSNTTGNDSLVVSVSADGTNWATVETVTGPGDNAWISRSFRVGAYVTPSATVQVRFRVSDNPDNSITEAGVDVFRAEAFSCQPCQQQIMLATNGTAVMSICGGNPQTVGSLSTLQVVSMPGLASGLLLMDVFLAPTPWNGGTLMSPAPILLGSIAANANGTFAAPVPLGGLLPPGFALHTQTVYFDAALPSGVGQTNAVRVQW